MFSARSFEDLCDRSRALLSSPRFMIWVIPLVVILRLLSSTSADPDLFARVAMGHLALSQATVPKTDPFAFSRTLSHWVDHEWLSGVVFYLTANLGGDFGIITLRGILAALTAVFVVCASRRFAPSSASRFIWITVCLAHSSAAWGSPVRCQAFTYLFTPLLYWAIVEYRASRNVLPLCLTPLTAIAWVNMHGGYALGCLIIGLFCLTEIAERRWSWIPITVAAGWAVAPFFTPYGFPVFVTFLLDSLSMYRPGIQEWEPLASDQTALLLTIALLVPLASGMILRRARSEMFAYTTIIFSAYCAFRHIRFLPFLMITAAVFGAPFIDAVVETLRARSPTRTLAIIRSGAFAVMCVLTLGAFQLLSLACSPRTYRLSYDAFPVSAVEWLRTTGTTGRLLVDFNLGSYALWRLYPRIKISVDGRYEEVYPQATVTDNSNAFKPHTAEGRLALERLNPTHILLPKAHRIEDPEAEFGMGWRVVYQDPAAFILSRDTNGSVASAVDYGRVPADMWTPQF